MIPQYKFDLLREKQAALYAVVDARAARDKTAGDLEAKILSLSNRLDSALRDRNSTFASVRELQAALEGAERELAELNATPLPEADLDMLAGEVDVLLAELSPVEVISRADRLGGALVEGER